MANKSKSKSGIRDSLLVVKTPNKYFNDIEKRQIIEEYLQTGITKREIWKKYTGQEAEHGLLLRWIRQFGYEERRTIFISEKDSDMSKEKKKPTVSIPEDFETLQLKKRIAELESQLKDAELKSIAFSTMVDIAEKEFKIPIRKKYNTKPSKR